MILMPSPKSSWMLVLSESPCGQVVRHGLCHYDLGQDTSIGPHISEGSAVLYLSAWAEICHKHFVGKYEWRETELLLRQEEETQKRAVEAKRGRGGHLKARRVF